MARPPLPLGEHGSISITAKRGRWVARCRYRSLNGVTRHVQKSGNTKTAARLALQEELRAQRGERTEVLRPNSRFRDAADVWMKKITERREDSTAEKYSYWLDSVILPALGELRLSECDVAQTDAFLSRLEQARRIVQRPDGASEEKPRYAANTRRTFRAIVGGVMQQAVLHQAIAANPVRELERIETPRGHRAPPPRGLTAEERRKLLDFVDTDKVARNAGLPDLVRVALGSGLRIGELCALRWVDLNLDGIPVVSATDMRMVPVIAVRQNVYPVKGKGLSVHQGKSAMALRIVPLPAFVTLRLRTRLHADDDPAPGVATYRSMSAVSRPEAGRRTARRTISSARGSTLPREPTRDSSSHDRFTALVAAYVRV